MKMNVAHISALGALTLGTALTACAPAGAPEPQQTAICTTNVWAPGANKGFCEEGRKIAYLPESFGNQQLPLYFIGANCDLRYSVAMSNGGAVCIFKPIDPEQTVAFTPKPAENTAEPQTEGQE